MSERNSMKSKLHAIRCYNIGTINVRPLQWDKIWNCVINTFRDIDHYSSLKNNDFFHQPNISSSYIPMSVPTYLPAHHCDRKTIYNKLPQKACICNSHPFHWELYASILFSCPRPNPPKLPFRSSKQKVLFLRYMDISK